MVRYELRSGKGDMGTLQVRIVGKGVNTKVSTGVKLKTKEWCVEAQMLRHANDMRAVAYLGGLSYAQLSERLTELKRVLDVVDKRGELNVDTVKRYIIEMLKEKVCGRVVDTGRNVFLNFIDQFIEDMENGAITKARTHERYREYYINMFRTLRSKVEQYQKEKRVDIGWGGLTKNFYDKFCAWMTESGLKTNSVTNVAARLRVVVKEAERRKLVMVETDIEEWDGAYVIPDAVVSLSYEKLNQMYHMDFTSEAEYERLLSSAKTEEDRKFVETHLKTQKKRKKMQNALNVFLLCCYTGQRFGDHGRITEDATCILSDGREYIHIKQQKTSSNLYIPLDERAKELLKREHHSLSAKSINKMVKDIGRILGWTELTTFTEEVNGIKYPSQKKFYEYLQSHTARRTFASLAYKRGVCTQAIMAVTGHKSEMTLRRYIRVSEEEKAIMASQELFKVSISKEV